MSRLSILLAGLAGLAVGGVFLSSTAVQHLSDRLQRLENAIAVEREQIEVLEADWAFLNRPARLEALARRHLDLAPARADQFGTLKGIALRWSARPEIHERPSGSAPDDAAAIGQNLEDGAPGSSHLRGEPHRTEPELPTVMVDVRAAPGRADEPLMISWGRTVRLPPASRVGDEIGVLIATLGGR